MSNNPLQNYYRVPKTYVKLPSGTSYYTADIVEFTESGELAIKAMTSKDEMTYKNPDALLNGEAIRQALLSCVVGMHKPEKMLAPDIEVLLIAIKAATNGDNMEIEAECPNCKHINKYDVDLNAALHSAKPVEEENIVVLSNGVSVYLKPYSYSDSVKATGGLFEQSKVFKTMQDETVPEEQKFKLFTSSFNKMAGLNVELVANSIIKIAKEVDNLILFNNQENKKHFIEFLANIEKADSDLINERLNSINTSGISKELTTKCEKCEHSWTSLIDYNPVNFSIGS